MIKEWSFQEVDDITSICLPSLFILKIYTVKWIEATDLERWASEIDSQKKLPRLIRRLVLATHPQVLSIAFPAGNSVQLGGYDGILSINGEHEFLPDGNSVWELGTNKDIKGKADDDFDKRSNDDLGQDKETSTFCFVTLRSWTQKEKWVNAKRKQNIWKDVIVYDADDLELWLDQSPSVSAWLSIEIGKYPDLGIQTMEDFWEEWSFTDELEISPQLVTARRGDFATNKIHQYLQQASSLLILQADAPEEAIAFLVGTALLWEEVQQEYFFSKSLIISSEEIFRSVSRSRSPLIIVCKFDNYDILQKAVRDGHHIILPVGLEYVEHGQRNVISLPRLDRVKFRAAMLELGISSWKTELWSRQSARSLTILRRILGFSKNIPIWGKPESFEDILPALFVDRWDESLSGDKEVLLALSNNNSYENYTLKLSRWLRSSDSPVYKIGNKWRLASQLDAWIYLGRYLGDTQLERFKQVLLKTIKKIHPKFQASTTGFYSQDSYSTEIKEGLCRSLVLIAVKGDALGIKVNYQLENWADQIVFGLLGENSYEGWASMSNVLPLLAEASPSQFLQAVEQSLQSESKPILKLFRKSSQTFYGDNYYFGLLWALEVLAWIPTYLGRVVQLLLDLIDAPLEEKGQTRAINTLREMLRPWNPQTSAPLKARLEVFEQIKEKYPDKAWVLFLSLLPNSFELSHPNRSPEWRDIPEIEPSKLPTFELVQNYEKISEHLLALARQDEKRLAVLASKFDLISEQVRKNAIAEISSMEQPSYDIWKAISRLVEEYRLFKSAKWKMGEEILQELEILAEKVKPASFAEKALYHFEDRWNSKFYGDDWSALSSEEIANLVRNERVQVVKEVYEEGGLEGISYLLIHAKESYLLGQITAFIIEDAVLDEYISSFLCSQAVNERHFLFGLIKNRSGRVDGEAWVTASIKKLKEKKVNHHLIGLFCTGCHQYFSVLVFLGEYPAIEETYWTNTRPIIHNRSTEEQEFILKKLKKYGRFGRALHLIAGNTDDLSTALIIELLEAAAKEADRSNANFQISQIFTKLDERYDLALSKMLELEWSYASTLLASYRGRKTKVIYEEISRNPAFYVDMLKLIYKEERASEGQSIESTEEENKRSRIPGYGFKILYNWKLIPGISQDGILDESYLLKWVKEARKLAIACKRRYHCDQNIGRVLAHYSERHEDWPSLAICQILETDEVGTMRNEFRVGVWNRHGFSSRGLFDGGEREYKMADFYRRHSLRIAATYPKTSGLLEQLAKNYERSAKEEDHTAEWDELNF